MATVTKTVRTVKTTKTVRIAKTVTITREKSERLSFGRKNAKLGKETRTFSLPAGYSCPFALACLSKADRATGKITDGPATEFRCFSASAEAMYPSVRKSRWCNFELLKGKSGADMAELILDSLSSKVNVVRIHVSGDFFSQAYFDAWLEVARARPATLFYAYTKSLRFWVARLDSIPSNLVLTASHGGKDDALIAQHGLRSAVVVMSDQEALERGLAIDHDDSLAMSPNGQDFALLLHGAQPKGSLAGKALAALRAQGEYGYGSKADARREEAKRMPLAMLN